MSNAAVSHEEAPEEDLPVLTEQERSALVEALLFAHGELLSPSRIAEVSGLEREEVNDILESLEMKFGLEESGIQLVNVGGKYQFRTKGLFGVYLQRLKSSRPRKLTPAALETLAVVAYRQPVVKADIESIRGVDCTPTIKTLLERGIIRIVGHKASVGQPALFGTTEKFLSIFGLSSLSELPTLRDLQELEQDPGEIGEESEEPLQSEDQDMQDEAIEETVLEDEELNERALKDADLEGSGTENMKHKNTESKSTESKNTEQVQEQDVDPTTEVSL